jgi:hypothetical protein
MEQIRTILEQNKEQIRKWLLYILIFLGEGFEVFI